MTEHDPRVRAAFDVLRDVVADLQLRDRKTLIQGVKPRLQVETGGKFDEQELGFESFGAFVQAAAAAGVIHVARVRHGFALSLPGSTPDAAQTQTRPRINHNLWRAFTDWSHDRRYAWDPNRRVVVTFPVDEENEENATLIPENLVPIPPASGEEQLEWVREFLEAQKGSRVADALLSMLDGDDAFEQFSLLVRSEPRLDGEWRGQRRSRVADAIRSWAQEQDVQIDPYMEDEIVAVPVLSSVPSSEDPVERLRSAVKYAIDKMSAAELRELRLPLGSLEGSGL
jgi:hypothetical protein